jgi:23S rRNA pseudouridine955/2504/2580 synthase
VLQNLGQFTLVEAKPITGRTHQIRVHCQHMGHPIVGDPKYGVDAVNQAQRQLGLNRLFLHAAQLRLIDPSTEKKIDVRAPLDQRLQQAVDRLS